MRVMHVMAGAAEGGAENIMLESVLALAEAGLTQHVVTRPDNQFRVQKFREAGIGVDVAAFNNAWPFPTRRVLGDAIKAFKPDVIEYWMGCAEGIPQPLDRLVWRLLQTRPFRELRMACRPDDRPASPHPRTGRAGRPLRHHPYLCRFRRRRSG